MKHPYYYAYHPVAEFADLCVRLDSPEDLTEGAHLLWSVYVQEWDESIQLYLDRCIADCPTQQDAQLITNALKKAGPKRYVS